jgi:hypothetical protein
MPLIKYSFRRTLTLSSVIDESANKKKLIFEEKKYSLKNVKKNIVII